MPVPIQRIARRIGKITPRLIIKRHAGYVRTGLAQACHDIATGVGARQVKQSLFRGICGECLSKLIRRLTALRRSPAAVTRGLCSSRTHTKCDPTGPVLRPPHAIGRCENSGV